MPMPMATGSRCFCSVRGWIKVVVPEEFVREMGAEISIMREMYYDAQQLPN